MKVDPGGFEYGVLERLEGHTHSARLANAVERLFWALWSCSVLVDGFMKNGCLLLELAFFISATWSLFVTGATNLGWVYGVAVFVHYVVSYHRILWLIHQ